jgi:hypothetical protein
MHEFFKKEWQAISPNAKLDAVKWAAVGMVSAGYLVLQKIRHLSPDWYVFVGLFVLSALTFLYLGRREKTPARANEQAPETDTATGSPSKKELEDLAAYAAAMNREIVTLREKLKEAKKPTLPDRIGEIARELLQFLQEQEPVPKITGHDLQARYESIREAWKINSERVPKIHNGYMARFNDRVEKIIFELGAMGIRDWELNNLVNKNAHSEVDIESIANKLLALGGQFLVQEYGSHFQVSSSSQDAKVNSALRPKIFAEFVPEPNAAHSPRYGLLLTNDGESAAYNITVPDMELGESKIQVRTDDISRLTKGEKHFCDVSILTFPQREIGGDVPMRIAGQQLYTEMKRLETREVSFVIRYNDDCQIPYATRCKLERNIGRVIAKFVGLE